MEIDKNRLGYYAVIPGKVLSSTVSSQAKLYYGAITLLVGVEGYCEVTNEALGKLFGKSESNAKECINELKATGHIVVVTDKAAGNKRKLYLGDVFKSVSF